MTNAQSLGNKIDELRTLAVMLEPDVIAVTETWTNDTTGNPIWDIRGYEILARNDRNDTEGGRGGGILWREASCQWVFRVCGGLKAVGYDMHHLKKKKQSLVDKYK